MTVKKHLRAQEVALHNHLPCVYLVDSGGAFLPGRTRCSPTASTSAGSSTTRRRCPRTGIPQIAAVLGSCTAGGAYVPAMSDEAVIVREPGHDLPRRPAAGEGRHRRGRHRRGTRRRRPARARLRRDRPPRRRRRATRCGSCGDRRHARPARRRAPGTSRPSRRRCTTPTSSTAWCPPTCGPPTTCARSSPGSSTAAGSPSSRRSTAPTLVTGFARIHGHPVGIIANNGDPVQRVRAEGRALHRAVRPAPDPAGLPAEHHRLHGRPAVRGGRHRQARRQDGHRGRLRAGARSSP